jgi:hypothetical protein
LGQVGRSSGSREGRGRNVGRWYTRYVDAHSDRVPGGVLDSRREQTEEAMFHAIAEEHAWSGQEQLTVLERERGKGGQPCSPCGVRDPFTKQSLGSRPQVDGVFHLRVRPPRGVTVHK